MGISEKEKKAAQAFARLGGLKGGKARAEALTPEERQEIAREAANARWSKHKRPEDDEKILRATYGSPDRPLRIGEIEIPCYVLEDGTRVVTHNGMLTALALGRGGIPQPDDTKGYRLSSFAAGKRLQSFISKELAEGITTPIPFRTPKGQWALGYEATILADLCEAVLQAWEADKLDKRQHRIAERCQILMRGVSRVGIIGLVDEATGYQEVRDRLALQEILDKFLRKEFAAWAKRFPDEFYQHIFRLCNWQWRGMMVNRPQIVAHYTKDFVYARLAPGILKELEVRNPKDERGYRKAKHHMFFTDDIGHPALAQHLHAVVGLLRVADTWEHFQGMINKAFPRRGDTLQLPLFKDDEFPAN